MNRKGTHYVKRRSCPTVMLGKAEINRGLDIMIVTIRNTGTKHKLFMRLCHARNFGWEEIAAGMYAVSGLAHELHEALPRQWWVKDWWWDHNAVIMTGSGAGTRPKRSKEPTIAKMKSLDIFSQQKIAKLTTRHGQPM